MLSKYDLKLWNEIAIYLKGDISNQRYAEGIKYILDKSKNLCILDVGCGQGVLLKYLKQLGFTYLIGVDIAEEQIRLSKKIASRVSLIISSAEKLPIKASCIDIIFSLATIEHIPNPQSFMSEISRIIKNGANVVMSSDCYIWKIFRSLKLARTIMPINNTISLKNFFDMFENNSLNVINYNAWGVPFPGITDILPQLFGKFFKNIAVKYILAKYQNKNIQFKKYNEKDSVSLLKMMLYAENIFYLIKI